MRTLLVFLAVLSFLRMEIENEEILRWWDCSILWGTTSNSLTQPHRGVMSQMRVRLFISSIVSTRFYILGVCMCVPVCQLCVCLCVPLYVFAHSMWVFRCGSGVCKCAGFSRKKDPYTGLKSLIKGWQIFLASCVVLKLLLGSSSLGLPLFTPSSPTFSHPWLLKGLQEGSVLHRALSWHPS